MKTRVLIKIFLVLFWAKISWSYILTLDDMPKNGTVMNQLEDFEPQTIEDAEGFFEENLFATAHILIASAIDRYPLELTPRMVQYRRTVGHLLEFRLNRREMQRYYRPNPENFDHIISDVLNHNERYYEGERENPQPQPANNQIIKIPKKRYVMVKTKKEEPCPICCEDDKTFCQLKSCKHKFHLECIEKWYKIKKNCPLCRAEIED